jgi:DNA-binding Lrp family transcriptional regulator
LSGYTCYRRLDKFKTDNIVERITTQVNERKLKDQINWRQGRWRKQHGTMKLRSEGQEVEQEDLDKGILRPVKM